ncbi:MULTISPECIES: polyprenyl synthetase family protein [Streptomyces]|uniref:polyprenyl synthetase family protein n=1 Tax=Streptomyces TaxID=1883 RepID=UPI000F788DFF|nr:MULTISPECIES: polyprenyl synthetase family protein [Streptomyces]RST08993.1 polyprenyl synthetase family protein [Streptomyces sp. WAC07149]GLX19498.1 polyprenyl synthetase [Streptomyces lavendulae subsp. lavendulae]GLX26993.1 polyprenyl synthetase [Streptomyces lavendulae subsp. lavendulae]
MSEQWDGAGFKDLIDVLLEEFLAAEAERLLTIDEALGPVAEQLRVATRHGKRMRAAFCYWGWRAAGMPDSDALLRAAASMELVHAAATVHDDIIDDSPIRHGLPTAHVALKTALARGARPRAGARSLAMLVGDHLMALAGQLFAESGLPAAYLTRARPVWADLARELIAGECLEILATGSSPDPEVSLKVVRYKTAKYTVEQPLLIGALLAGASPGLREALSAYGLPLGEAFQLRDDLLGLFGDPARTGKASLDDIRGNRPTALLAMTWQAAPPAQRERLAAVLGRRDLDDGHLHEVRELMLALEAPQRVEELIAHRVREAVRHLSGAGVPAQARQALTVLAHHATDRHR